MCPMIIDVERMWKNTNGRKGDVLCCFSAKMEEKLVATLLEDKLQIDSVLEETDPRGFHV